MGREVRLVPRGWQHPTRLEDWRNPYSEQKPVPLRYGWDKDVAEFEKMLKEGKSVDYCLKYFGGPSPHDYMDADWKDEGLNPELLVMYEDTSEGTPISPAFETPEELARWLADTKASAFGDMTATYEEWLSTVRRGHAICAVMGPDGMKSGVQAQSEKEDASK